MAGTWTDQELRRGHIDSTVVNAPQAIEMEYTADAADASVPDGTFTGIGGSIMAMDVELDGTATPDSCTATLKTAAGVEILTSGALTASGRTYPAYGVAPAAGDLTIEISNTGNSAKAKIVLYVV